MVSVIFSVIALVFALVGLIPFLGILNWIAIIFAIIAFISGIVGAVVKKQRGAYIAGIVISILVSCIAIIRLVLGGGIL